MNPSHQQNAGEPTESAAPMLDSLWTLDRPDEPTEPVAPHGVLWATVPQRFRFHGTGRAARVTAATSAVAVMACGAYAAREPISDAWERALNTDPTTAPHQTVTASPSPSADATYIAAVADAKASIAQLVLTANATYTSGHGKIDEGTCRELARARNAAESAANFSSDLASLTAAEMDLRDALGAAETALQAWEVAEAQRKAEEVAAAAAAANSGSQGSAGAGSSGGGPKPAQNPPAQPPSSGGGSTLASYSKTVTCNESATIVFTATGGGSISLSAGGQSTTGGGSVQLTVNAASATAKATATGSVGISYSWSGSGSTSCSG